MQIFSGKDRGRRDFGYAGRGRRVPLARHSLRLLGTAGGLGALLLLPHQGSSHQQSRGHSTANTPVCAAICELRAVPDTAPREATGPGLLFASWLLKTFLCVVGLVFQGREAQNQSNFCK